MRVGSSPLGPEPLHPERPRMGLPFIFMPTRNDRTPSAIACPPAAPTAGNPSVSRVARMATIWRSPSLDPASLRRTRPKAVGSTQSLNGAVAQRARFTGENRDVVPGIVDRLAASEAALMFGDNAPV